MYTKEECYKLGSIARLHSFKGEVSIFLDVDTPQEYKELESVFVEYDNKLIPFFIEHIYIRNNGFAVVKFEGVNTDKKAKLFLKCGLFLPLETLPELEDNEFYYFEIEGFTVVDSKFGQIGKVSKVIDLKGNPLIEILRRKQEILLPKQDEFIDEVNWDTKTLYISAPEGLLKMYFEEE
ncbi:MAG TPA: 16S rRNA processing protein RimM [Crocinitomix sp.]|nr:16S rRNA processing protein RimM [Crocinitomix sp.]